MLFSPENPLTTSQPKPTISNNSFPPHSRIHLLTPEVTPSPLPLFYDGCIFWDSLCRLIIDHFPPLFTIDVPIPINLEPLVILWPLERPRLMIYLLLPGAFRDCFAVVTSGVFCDFQLISSAPNEPPSSHIDILTRLETGKCYLEDCSVWFPNFNCSRRFLRH